MEGKAGAERSVQLAFTMWYHVAASTGTLDAADSKGFPAPSRPVFDRSKADAAKTYYSVKLVASARSGASAQGVRDRASRCSENVPFRMKFRNVLEVQCRDT